MQHQGLHRQQQQSRPLGSQAIVLLLLLLRQQAGWGRVTASLAEGLHRSRSQTVLQETPHRLLLLQLLRCCVLALLLVGRS